MSWCENVSEAAGKSATLHPLHPPHLHQQCSGEESGRYTYACIYIYIIYRLWLTLSLLTTRRISLMPPCTASSFPDSSVRTRNLRGKVRPHNRRLVQKGEYGRAQLLCMFMLLVCAFLFFLSTPGLIYVFTDDHL